MGGYLMPQESTIDDDDQVKQVNTKFSLLYDECQKRGWTFVAFKWGKTPEWSFGCVKDRFSFPLHVYEPWVFVGCLWMAGPHADLTTIGRSSWSFGTVWPGRSLWYGQTEKKTKKSCSNWSLGNKTLLLGLELCQVEKKPTNEWLFKFALFKLSKKKKHSSYRNKNYKRA